MIQSLKMHVNVIIKKIVMWLLLVNSWFCFGRQSKTKQHCVLWVNACVYNIQNLAIISFSSYVCFKCFSETDASPLRSAASGTVFSFFSPFNINMLLLTHPFFCFHGSFLHVFTVCGIQGWRPVAFWTLSSRCTFCISALTVSSILRSVTTWTVYEGRFRNSPVFSCCRSCSVPVSQSSRWISEAGIRICWLLSRQSIIFFNSQSHYGLFF